MKNCLGTLVILSDFDRNKIISSKTKQKKHNPYTNKKKDIADNKMLRFTLLNAKSFGM